MTDFRKKSILLSVLFCTLIAFFFTGCEFFKSLVNELDNPVSSLYIYVLDEGLGETDSVEITEGETVEIMYQAEYYEGQTESCKVNLFADDDSVVSLEWDSKEIGTDGVFEVTGKKKGSALVTMQVDGYALNSSIRVSVKEKVGVFLNQATLSLYQGDSCYLGVRNTYDKKSLKWSVIEGSYYVSVSSGGMVTAKAPGKAKVKVSSYDGRYSDTCEITVLDTKSWKVNITNKGSIPGESDFIPGQKFTLTAAATGLSSGISDSISWVSSNPSIAQVNVSTGEVKAIAEGSAVIKAYLDANNGIYDSVTVKVGKPPVTCQQFFWGTWVRMDNGDTYEITETKVTYKGKTYNINNSSASEIEIADLGKFSKDSDGSDKILVWHDSKNDIDIPFFRQGGANLEYKIRVVGFEDEILSNSRAAGSSVGKKNIKVKAQSDNYSSYQDSGETNADGEVTLVAPVQGDTQTLTIGDGDSMIVVPGIKIENSGDFMGTIPLVREDDYSLKITGVVKDADKTNGYMYGNNHKKYPLELSITNISNIKSETAIASISCDDPNVTISIVDSIYTLDEIMISSMKPGQTKVIKLEVSYGNLTSTYKEVELNVNVENGRTGRTWIDYVPLRFFAGDMPITISARSTEGNNCALNGFLIYPDGNSKFFSVPASAKTESKTLYVPVFGSGTPYELVFCGATVTGELSDSTEAFYSVALDSSVGKEIPVSGLKEIYNYGEKNDTESTAYSINEDFIAYLDLGDVDYYLISASSDSQVVHSDK